MNNKRLRKVSTLLEDDYRLLLRHIQGKTLCKVIAYTETIVSFEFDDQTILNISNLEGELLFDITMP